MSEIDHHIESCESLTDKSLEDLIAELTYTLQDRRQRKLPFDTVVVLAGGSQQFRVLYIDTQGQVGLCHEADRADVRKQVSTVAFDKLTKAEEDA